MITKTKKTTKPKAAAKKKAIKPPSPGGKWFLINAENRVLGRIAVLAANTLSGKNTVYFERHKDLGSHVIIINAKKVKVTGRKMEQKTYKHYSGYPSGLIVRPLSRYMVEKPEFPIMHAVKGMLPKNSLGNHMIKKLLVYPDAQHPHSAQKPIELKSGEK